MIVGLTGGYCAGKDVVARVLAGRGFSVIDVDALGHDALREKEAEVIAAFGPSVRTATGIDRKALGRIVFSDAAALARLESVVHPVMVRDVKKMIAAMSGDVLINAAILHHMGLHTLCHAVICVRAPRVARVFRAMRRDRLTFRAAWARIRAQKDVCASGRGTRHGLFSASGRGTRHGLFSASGRGKPQFNDPPVDTYTVRNRGSMRSLERRVAQLDRLMRG